MGKPIGGQIVKKRQWTKKAGIGLLLLLASLLTTGWWSASFTRRGQATRYVLEHRAQTWWEDRFGYAPLDWSRTGSISGIVSDPHERQVAGAVVVVSTDQGRTISAHTDPKGRYRLEGVPEGRYVPAVAAHGYLAQVYDSSPWQTATPVRVRAGQVADGINFSLQPSISPDLPTHIKREEPVLVSNDYPAPTTALRTQVTFVRDGYAVVCHVYEPYPRSNEQLPAIIAAYPGETLNWEPASIAFVAQGYLVLGLSPVSGRDLDITADAQDLVAAIMLLYENKISARANPERMGALGGSLSSLALLRALRHAPYVRGAVLMGGLTDLYSLRHAVYADGYSGYTVRPALEWAMWSMGRPDRTPRMYVENSVLHSEGLPPLCIIHGTRDAVIPYTQSERLAEVLAEARHPYELHIYQGTGHYPGIHDPDPDTEDMYQEMVRFFAQLLAE
jgi:dipeptidyl aminopeptidase/acylaminoacyl peptidase